MKPRAIKGLKIAVGILIAFVLAEATLRLLGFPTVNTNTFDKSNLVIFKPDQTFLVKDRCYASELVSNDQGFHAENFSIKKPANTFRIVVLGDSFVEAVQVPLEKTFPYLLEQKLNDTLGVDAPGGGNGKTYQVIPIAKSGNGTLMNLEYAREYALQYNPDLVIDSFITNDLQDDMTAVATLHATSTVTAIGKNVFDANSFFVSPPSTGSAYELFLKHYLLERSLLFERWWMNLTVIKSQIGQKSVPASVPAEGAISSGLRIDSFVEAQLEPQSDLARTMWANEAKSLQTMDSYVTGHGSQFLLVQLAEGYLFDSSELASRYYLSPAQVLQFNNKLAGQKLAAIAAQDNFPFFSTQDYFTQEFQKTGELPILSCDNHYNELGQQEAADAIYGYLSKRL